MNDLRYALRQLLKYPGFTMATGWIPARRASRVDPVSALKAE